MPRDTASPTGSPIRVLFVCTGNSARSQMAEALLERIGGPDFEAASAGTHATGVNPYTVRALGELGIDWSAAVSTPLEAVSGQAWDHVVTVCDRARQSCPVFPGRPDMLHWDLEDPADAAGTDEEILDTFRRTIVDLQARIPSFVAAARHARAQGVTEGSEALG